jgi:uncharacterized protein with HEPN domain
MRHEVNRYLYDVAQAADLIAQFTAGKTFEDYLNDPMLRAAWSANLKSSARLWLNSPNVTRP